MSSTIDLYTDHFGLSARPFSLVPDPDFLFWSPAHRRAFAILEYGIVTRAPITLVTGEVGAGKTTLLRHLLAGIGDDVRVGLIANASERGRNDMLRWVLSSLDQPTSTSDGYVDLFERLQAYLIDEYALGRRVILIFDEAQNLGHEALEELRMLTNINSGKDELVQLVLVGQPELRDMVLRPELRQFAQRVAASFHLPAMGRDTVGRYVSHRLEVAGGAPDLFSEDACALIHEQTGGIPRLVNQLCDLAMVYGYTSDEDRITAETIRQVLFDNAFFGGGRTSEPVRLVDPLPRLP